MDGWFGQPLPAPPLGGAFFEPLVRSSSLFHKNSPATSLQAGYSDRDFGGVCRFSAQGRKNPLKMQTDPLKRENGAQR